MLERHDSVEVKAVYEEELGYTLKLQRTKRDMINMEPESYCLVYLMVIWEVRVCTTLQIVYFSS